MKDLLVRLPVESYIEDATAELQHALNGVPLSLRLREETQTLHNAVERALGLPASIQSISDYRKYLHTMYLFYSPMEDRLDCFTGWGRAGIDLEDYEQASRLIVDLKALGISVVRRDQACGSALPQVPSFAHALGALYVLEGSTLGAQFILRSLAMVLGDQMAGACTFLRGRGPASAEHWKGFRGLLDIYGRDHGAQTANVIEGARQTFQAIGRWFQPADGR